MDYFDLEIKKAELHKMLYIITAGITKDEEIYNKYGYTWGGSRIPRVDNENYDEFEVIIKFKKKA